MGARPHTLILNRAGLFSMLGFCIKLVWKRGACGQESLALSRDGLKMNLSSELGARSYWLCLHGAVSPPHCFLDF